MMDREDDDGYDDEGSRPTNHPHRTVVGVPVEG